MLTAVAAMIGAAWVASPWIGMRYGSDEFDVGFGIVCGAFHLDRGLHELGPDVIGWNFRWGGQISSLWMRLPRYTRVSRYQSLLIPLWLPLLPCLIAATWMWWNESRPWFGAGACNQCGYDLAGIAKGAKCPECGAKAS